jgi:hypothetical protein
MAAQRITKRAESGVEGKVRQKRTLPFDGAHGATGFLSATLSTLKWYGKVRGKIDNGKEVTPCSTPQWQL